MPAGALVQEPDAPVLWEVRRAPTPRVRAIAWGAGIVFAVLGGALLQALMLQPDWRISLAVGVAIGILVPLGVGHGAVARVHADGTLLYGFGRHPTVLVPFAAIHEWRYLTTGITRGIGLRLDRGAVGFTSRKGISFATMDRARRHLGVDLLLEFLTEDDLARLRDLARPHVADRPAAEPRPAARPGTSCT